MKRLQVWQLGLLCLPLIGVLGFLGLAAGFQIHQWGLNWIWAVVGLGLVGWRWLLVRWLKSPELNAAEVALSELTDSGHPDPAAAATHLAKSAQRQQSEAELQQVLVTAREDGPPWENWPLFFQRCQRLVEAIALIYHPQVKRPLLNIYVPQAYSLLRGTVDDVDQWMQKLTPILGQVSIGQAYEAYETYQKLEPAARLALKAWNWAQWIFNPFVALARTVTRGYSAQANQQLVMNLGQLLREATLKALGERAIVLYSGEAIQSIALLDAAEPAQTQTLRDLFAQAASIDPIDQRPLNLLLMGRTGAGKSSLINTLFRQELATVDVLPSTDQLQTYTWSTPDGQTLCLWDTPGSEQVGMSQYAQILLKAAATADLVLLVTPVNDPTLQMDLEQVQALQQQTPDVPILTVVTQVDRLRPLREWEPPYDWEKGDRPKEYNIRAAIEYRESILKDYCAIVLPLVTENLSQGRSAWGAAELCQAILSTIEPAQQIRLSRFLRDLDLRTQAAAKIIDHYTFQMGTAQGLTAFLKTPVLKFLSTVLTGSPALAIVLAEKLPLEQTPIVLGKLQMAFELYGLLSPSASVLQFELLTLWPLITDCKAPVAQDAWALGHTLVEYWTRNEAEIGDRPVPNALPNIDSSSLRNYLSSRYQDYLQQDYLQQAQPQPPHK